MSTNSPLPSKPGKHMAAGDLRSYFRLLRHNPAFTRFWLAGVISHIGNWFNYIGIFVLLSSHTGSGQAVSWFLIAKFLPAFLWGPMAGVLADRLPRKMIMIAGDLIRAVLVLGYLVVDSADYLWLVYVLALSQETVWSFTDPARRASVPNLCAKEELKVANSLSGATWSVMLAIGAGLGGFVTALFDWQTAILVDAATFTLSAAILTTLPLPHKRRTRPAMATWSSLTGLTDLQEGWRYILQRQETTRLILVKSGWAMAGGIMVMLTVFGEQVFGGENGGKSGILYSARGIGAALGPVTAWKLFGEERPEMIRAIGFGFFMAAASYLCFSQSPSLIPAAFFVFFAHLGGSVQWVFSTTILQETVPDSFRGRVFAAEMGLLTLVLSISTWLTGFILDLGVDPRLISAGLAACFLLPGLAWSMTAILPNQNTQSKKQ